MVLRGRRRQEVVKEDFDPDRFISVFASRDSSQLAWLDDLKADTAGRRLIYQLSASHRSCLVLNFAIQKILRAGTHEYAPPPSPSATPPPRAASLCSIPISAAECCKILQGDTSSQTWLVSQLDSRAPPQPPMASCTLPSVHHYHTH